MAEIRRNNREVTDVYFRKWKSVMFAFLRKLLKMAQPFPQLCKHGQRGISSRIGQRGQPSGWNTLLNVFVLQQPLIQNG